MLDIGIIGLGPHWESQYRPALIRLSRRLRVAAVYDPVASRAERAAQELQAACLTSMRALLKRAEIRAVLRLDESWYGLAPLRLAVDSGKPLYVAGRLFSYPPEQLDVLHLAAARQSLVICPELRLRTAPATMRIMELTATQLGPVESAEIRLSIPRNAHVLPWLVTLLDVAGVVVRSMPARIEWTASNDAVLEFNVLFGRLLEDGQSVTVRVAVLRHDSTPMLMARLRCRHGTLTQVGEARISWQTEQGEPVHEQLDRERSGAEVLLDHFARRVVGGLVPIPGLDDVSRILRLLEPHRDAIAGNTTRD